MSQQGFEMFLKKVQDDKALSAKVDAVGLDSAKLIELGKQYGCDFGETDLEQFKKHVMEIQNELSDEDLEKVAGGVFSATLGVAAAVVGAGLNVYMAIKSSAAEMQQA